jgi:hypothetical protein
VIVEPTDVFDYADDPLLDAAMALVAIFDAVNVLSLGGPFERNQSLIAVESSQPCLRSGKLRDRAE